MRSVRSRPHTNYLILYNLGKYCLTSARIRVLIQENNPSDPEENQPKKKLGTFFVVEVKISTITTEEQIAVLKTMTNLSNGELTRIAVIDDDEDDYLFISDFIKAIDGKRFVTDWFRDYDSAMADIRNRSHHLYFVDYFLGNKTGLDLLKEASAMNFDRPIVLLTGFGSKDIDVRAMECGATDYLNKSELNSEKLERCMRYALERTSFLEELKARETKYRNLFEASKDSVFIADTNLVFGEVNQSALVLLESKTGSLLGRSLYDFIGDSVQKARIKDLVNSSGNIDDLEITIRRDDKDTRSCLLSLRVQEHTGQEPLVHGIIHDISNIKKAELVNLQAEKLAANERLVRMLAHEIRNPLNNIILSVEHLLPANKDESQINFLGIIERNSIRINQIITELLNLATPSELVFEKESLQTVIEESLARASDRILLHNIKVVKEYSATPLLIAADMNKLVIALTNILINAVESMEAHQGLLTIKLGTTADAYVLTIKDNGRGIPREYLSKLFDPFFTLKKNGMGLGLTASYSIIQSHKASILVESNVDEGTSFVIGFNKQ